MEENYRFNWAVNENRFYSSITVKNKNNVLKK